MTTTQNTTINAVATTVATLSEEDIFGAGAAAPVPSTTEQELAQEIAKKVAECKAIYTEGFSVDTSTGEEPATAPVAPPPAPTEEKKAATTATASKTTKAAKATAPTPAPQEQTFKVYKMEPSSKKYPAPVKKHAGQSAPTLWFVGNPDLLDYTGVGLILGERPGLENKGDSGYTNAKACIRKLAPSRVLVLGSQHRDVTERDREAGKYRFVRHGADRMMAHWITQVPEYKGVILVLGTALTQDIVDLYKEPLAAGKMMIITFIDPEAFDQKGSLNFTSLHRSNFVASYCQDVIVIETSNTDSGSWQTTMRTHAVKHRLHVILSPNLYPAALNKVAIDFCQAHPLVKVSDLGEAIR